MVGKPAFVHCSKVVIEATSTLFFFCEILFADTIQIPLAMTAMTAIAPIPAMIF
jgi:hypothetical protein